MSTLSLTLAKADADRLAEIAAREGVSVEQAAASAVKAQLKADDAARVEIETGLADLDRGAGVSFEAYEREMDAFIARLAA